MKYKNDVTNRKMKDVCREMERYKMKALANMTVAGDNAKVVK